MIELEDARVARGSFTLGPLTLSLAQGERLVVLGPSGAGKSTLLDVIAGFAALDAGQLRLGGADARAVPPEARRCAWVSQQDTLFPHLDVRGNLAFPLARRRVPAEERRALLEHAAERVGLAGALAREVAGLSGGERQRVAFARALLSEPRVLLCDEPFTGVDPGRRGALRELLLSLHEEQGFVLVFVTHEVAEARAIGERAATLIEGKLRRVGAVAEVLQDPGGVDLEEALGLGNSS